MPDLGWSPARLNGGNIVNPMRLPDRFPVFVFSDGSLMDMVMARLLAGKIRLPEKRLFLRFAKAGAGLRPRFRVSKSTLTSKALAVS
jgi:hypothetical protein